MQNITNVLILFITIILFHSHLNAGQIFKWVDKDGNVHFGDSPKAEVEKEEVQLKPSNTFEGAPTQSQQQLLENYQNRRNEKAKADQERLQRTKQTMADKGCAELHKRLGAFQKEKAPVMNENLPYGRLLKQQQVKRDAESAQLKKMIKARCR